MVSLKTSLLYESLNIAVAWKRAYMGTLTEYDYHLTPEDRRFWQFVRPRDVCNLALSSFHGYQIVAYLLTNFATEISIIDGVLQCRAPSVRCNQHMITFTGRAYIRPLVQLAGRFCRSIKFERENKDTFHRAVYMPDFMDGLLANSGYYKVSLTLVEPHLDVYPPNVTEHTKSAARKMTRKMRRSFVSTSLKYVTNDGIVRFLVVKEFESPVLKESFKLLEDLKVETLCILPDTEEEGRQDRFTLSYDIFYYHKPAMEYLKHFRCDYKINASVVMLMLKRYRIQKMSFYKVRLTEPKSHFPNKLQSVRKSVDDLWKAVVKHPTMAVYAYCTSAQAVSDIEWGDAMTLIYNKLPDFRFSEHTYYISCYLEKNQGSKRLVVKVVFYDHYYYAEAHPYVRMTHMKHFLQ